MVRLGRFRVSDYRNKMDRLVCDDLWTIILAYGIGANSEKLSKIVQNTPFLKAAAAAVPNFIYTYYAPQWDGEVTDCDESTFYHHLYTKEKFVVGFVSNHCGWCKRMLPAYHQAASLSPIPMFTVTREVADNFHDTILVRYEIIGFPEIHKFYRGQKISTYSGNRSVKSFIEFCKS
jgi:thiol-disulfide isomerase/thioredoxin